jgi:hypothetical protein
MFLPQHSDQVATLIICEASADMTTALALHYDAIGPWSVRSAKWSIGSHSLRVMTSSFVCRARRSASSSGVSSVTAICSGGVLTRQRQHLVHGDSSSDGAIAQLGFTNRFLYALCSEFSHVRERRCESLFSFGYVLSFTARRNYEKVERPGRSNVIQSRDACFSKRKAALSP